MKQTLSSIVRAEKFSRVNFFFFMQPFLLKTLNIHLGLKITVRMDSFSHIFFPLLIFSVTMTSEPNLSVFTT